MISFAAEFGRRGTGAPSEGKPLIQEAANRLDVHESHQEVETIDSDGYR